MDNYTKGVLTVIALALLLILARQPGCGGSASSPCYIMGGVGVSRSIEVEK